VTGIHQAGVLSQADESQSRPFRRRLTLGAVTAALFGPLQQQLVRAILAFRIRARHPTLKADPTSIWDYGYGDIDALEIGSNVSVGPFAEIVVYRRSPRSTVPGRLIIGDAVNIGFGSDIRAAGGTIRIGSGTGIAQNCILIAANHLLQPGKHFRDRWDKERCGIEIGNNVWTGAGCIFLPGCVVGDNAVIAAGSVVRGRVPPGELWGGVPARRIRAIAAEQKPEKMDGVLLARSPGRPSSRAPAKRSDGDLLIAGEKRPKAAD
jgi:acetyltransferase-like isoleucine patch superfamily enzyme